VGRRQGDLAAVSDLLICEQSSLRGVSLIRQRG
jgi:hypothetical protein